MTILIEYTKTPKSHPCSVYILFIIHNNKGKPGAGENNFITVINIDYEDTLEIVDILVLSFFYTGTC